MRYLILYKSTLSFFEIRRIVIILEGNHIIREYIDKDMQYIKLINN